MKKYTIGIYFDCYLSKVALILKNRPEWQAGKYNFPGGHIEDNENNFDCVIREFKEECGIKTSYDDWKHIGCIHNKSYYKVDIFTAIQDIEHGVLSTTEDQEVIWVDINKLPENIISNLFWLIPFAFNYWKQGNADNLVFGFFEYKYDQN
jgi:8-oxo-dGTP pyrophosphatase MutT (NUDIX family)